MRRAPVIVSSDRRVPELDQYRLAGYLYGVNLTPGPENGNAQIIGTDGFGAIADLPISTSWDLEGFLRNIRKENIAAEWATRAKGAVSLFVFERFTSRVLILPDALGASLVHYYEKDGIRAASSSLQELINTLRQIGIAPKKSLKFAIELVIATNGGLTPSSFENVKTLDIMHFLEIQTDKLVIHRYRNLNLAPDPDLEYEEVIERSSKEITDTVIAASRLKTDASICHLTGGFDSRLVAAATIKAGVSDSFKFFCQGDPVLPDKQLAEQVASELNLVMTDYSGVSTLRAPSDFGSGLVGPMKYSYGILPVGPHQGNTFSDSVILSGGYGGTFRSTYDYRLKDRASTVTSGELGRGLWGEYLFAGGDNSLISKEFHRFLSTKMEDKMNQGRNEGIHEDALGDFLYLQTRARYFIAHITSSWNTLSRRVDPLYSPLAIQTALSQPLSQRSGNGIGFDIASKLEPRILAYPFDSKKFDHATFLHQKTVEQTDFTSGPVEYDSKSNPRPELVDFGYLKIPKVTKADVELAKTMKARAYQIAGRNNVRVAINELLGSIPKNELSELFNLEELDKLRKRPANTRVRIRTLFNLYGSLAWYLDATD